MSPSSSDRQLAASLLPTVPPGFVNFQWLPVTEKQLIGLWPGFVAYFVQTTPSRYPRLSAEPTVDVIARTLVVRVLELREGFDASGHKAEQTLFVKWTPAGNRTAVAWVSFVRDQALRHAPEVEWVWRNDVYYLTDPRVPRLLPEYFGKMISPERAREAASDERQLDTYFHAHPNATVNSVHVLSPEDGREVVRLTAAASVLECVLHSRSAAFLLADAKIIAFRWHAIAGGLHVQRLALNFSLTPWQRADASVLPVDNMLRFVGERFLPGLRPSSPDSHALAHLMLDASAWTYRFPASPDQFAIAVGDAGRRLHIPQFHVDPDRGRAGGAREEHGEDGRVWRRTYTTRWMADPAGNGTIAAWTVTDEPATAWRGGKALMALETLALGHALWGELQLAKGQTHRVSRIVLGPGQHAANPYDVVERDYSGCATAREVSDLQKGDFCVGVYARPGARGIVERGAPLYLSSKEIARGAIVCAPTGTGKTHLLVRWAAAAAAGGYSTFIVDIKGNLLRKHRDNLAADGSSLFYFHPDPAEPSDRINFLADLDWRPPVPRQDESFDSPEYEERRLRAGAELEQRIDDVAETLLSKEGWERGVERSWYENRFRWLRAFIGILKLYELYYKKTVCPGRSLDLGDLYELVQDERKLYQWATAIRLRERELTEAPGTLWHRRPCLGVDYWLRELDLVIAPGALGDHVGGRRKEDSYASMTNSIVAALRPFSSRLRPKISDVGKGGRLFSIEDVLSGLNRGDSRAHGPERATVVFAAPQAMGDAVELLLGMVVRRIQRLAEKRLDSKGRSPRLLLLLDETSRIPAFDAVRYAAVMREAEAGCVLIYQDLQQIGHGNEEQTLELLRNVGAQVYLGTMTGNTATLFNRWIGRRKVLRFAASKHGTERGYSWDAKELSYFGDDELRELRAGRYPALVQVNDEQGFRKPFLVDRDETLLANGAP